jgi:Transposase
MFVGIDWASTEHAVCVLDQTGKTVRAFRIPHSAPGFNDLVARLRRLGTPAELPVAIERPDGRLVDRLLEAGHPVVPVRSNAIKAWREGEVVSGAKSDAGDAKVIAEQPAAAPPPAADAHAVLGRHPGAAGSGAGPGRTRPPARGRHQPAHGHPGRPAGPAPRPSSPTSNARSRSRSWSAIRPRSRPSTSASSAWPHS